MLLNMPTFPDKKISWNMLNVEHYVEVVRSLGERTTFAQRFKSGNNEDCIDLPKSIP